MNTRYIVITFVCLCLTAPLFAQGPPGESGIVVRDEGSGWFRMYTDFKRNYVAFHGVDVEAWCAGEEVEWDVWKTNLEDSQVLGFSIRKDSPIKASTVGLSHGRGNSR